MAHSSAALTTQKKEFHQQRRGSGGGGGAPSTSTFSGGGRKDKAAPPTSKNGPLFDSHCHIGLGFSYSPSKVDPTPNNCPHWPFLDEEGKHTCEEQFVRAIDSGVKRMTLVGIDDVTSTRVQLISDHLNRLALEGGGGDVGTHNTCNRRGGGDLHVFWTAGIHPHSAHLHKKQFPLIEKLVRDEVEELRRRAERNGKESGQCGDGSTHHDVPQAGASSVNASSSVSASVCSQQLFTRLVAIGETGMDFFKSKGSLEDQRESLWRHLLLAYELDLPVIIHARNADDELIQVFNEFIRVKAKEEEKRRESEPEGAEEENNKNIADGTDGAASAAVSKGRESRSSSSSSSPWRNGQIWGVMHCFSSDAKWMEDYLKLGFFISFTNNITYPKSIEIQDACARCPSDRILIETDSPFLPPQRVRGAVNEPMNTRDTFECACRLRGIFGDNAKMDEFQKQLWVNTNRLFNLPL